MSTSVDEDLEMLLVKFFVVKHKIVVENLVPNNGRNGEMKTKFCKRTVVTYISVFNVIQRRSSFLITTEVC